MKVGASLIPLTTKNGIDRRQKTAAVSEHYKLIFSKSPTGIVYFDRLGIITECNEKLISILDSRKDRLIGLSMLSLPDKKLAYAIEQVLAGKQTEFNGLYTSITSDTRKTTSVHALFSPITNEKNQVIGGVGIVEDNTLRYNYQKKLERSEQAFRSLFEHHPDGVLSVGMSGKITDANRVIEEITQCKRDDLIGSDISVLIIDQDRSPFNSLFFHPEQTASRTFESTCITKKGRVFPISVTRIPIFIEGKTEGFYAIIKDVSNQVETQNLLEKTYGMAKIGWWESNIEKQTFYWSELTREILDTDSNTMASCAESMSFLTGKHAHDTISRAMEKAVKTGESFDLEMVITTAANTRKWVRIIGDPEFQNGKCIRIYGSIQDINDLKQAQIESEQSRQILLAFTDKVRAPMFVKDNEGRYLLVNKEFRRHFCSDNLDIIGKTEFDILDKFTATYVHENDAIVLETNKSMLRERKVTTNRGVRHFLTHTFPLVNTAGLHRGIGGLSTDITDLQEAKDRAQKQREAISYLSSNKRLTESAKQQRLQAIARVTVKTLRCDTAIIWIDNDAFFTCRGIFENGKVRFVNEMTQAKFTLPVLLEHLKFSRILVSPDIKLDSRVQELVESGFFPDKASATMLSSIYLSGEIVGFVGVLATEKDRDWKSDEMNFTIAVTNQISNVIIDEERKAKEMFILGSLKEKEILLAEVHHRVKNNLAVISSMMQLQTMQSSNREVQRQLMNSVGRIGAMAAIHEQLYRNENFSDLDFSDSLKTLVDSIVKATPSETNVALAFDCSPVTLSVLKAIPCSLIVNEVVTNILKYAFQNRDAGLITCKLKTDNNIVLLRIIDNGNELPAEFIINNNEIADSNDSLGLKIIQVLSEQLNGEYSYQSNPSGAIFRLDFHRK